MSPKANIKRERSPLKTSGLVVTRKIGQALELTGLDGSAVTITTLTARAGRVRYHVAAPPTVQLVRDNAKNRDPRPAGPTSPAADASNRPAAA